jgi:hypothetical protein
MLKIPKVFYADRRSASAAADVAVIDHTTRMLRRVASDFRLRAGEHEIVTEPARRGRACRVTLRTAAVILGVAVPSTLQAVAVTLRARRGRSDISGGRDNAVTLAQPGSRDGYNSLLSGLRLAAGVDSDCR